MPPWTASQGKTATGGDGPVLWRASRRFAFPHDKCRSTFYTEKYREQSRAARRHAVGCSTCRGRERWEKQRSVVSKSDGGPFVSIVRVGLAETKKFAEGYDAIFGKKKAAPVKQEKASAEDAPAKKKKKAKKK